MSNPHDPYGQQSNQYPQQGGYPSQPADLGQYPQYAGYPAGQFPGQYPGGQYPGQYPGQPAGYGQTPPPPRKSNRTAIFVAAGIALGLVAVVVIAAVLLVTRPGGGTEETAAPTTPPVVVPGGGCGFPGQSQVPPTDPAAVERIASGPLSFPRSAVPDWQTGGYITFAQSTEAAGVSKSMGDGQPWQAGAEVGQTNFGVRVSSADAATAIVQCVADGQGFRNANPRIEGQTPPEAITVDGTPAHKVTAQILVNSPGVLVPGDDITIIVIDSAPQTYALVVIPIGQADMAADGQRIIDELKVAREV